MTALIDKIDTLDKKIIAFIRNGVNDAADTHFNSLALEIFALQYSNIPLYKGYCDKRGATPKTTSSWQKIPAVPTDVFKVAALSLLPDQTVKQFMTSGTTRPEERGKVSYDAGGLRIMNATIETSAAAFLFPDGLRTQLLVIAPHPDHAPQMVMAYGMNHLIHCFGNKNSRFCVDDNGFDVNSFITDLNSCIDRNTPLTLCGGSFGFVNFFDFCAAEGLQFALPPGSRCLDAGGFKGKSREVTRSDFTDMCHTCLGIPENACINLLGMTEIASQFYDNTLKNAHRGATGPTVKCNPPWTRTQVVDPDTLTPLPPGEPGLLKHLDLANRGHIIAIQTDDVGQMTETGFEVFGRARDDEARGCSLTIDEMTRVMKDM